MFLLLALGDKDMETPVAAQLDVLFTNTNMADVLPVLLKKLKNLAVAEEKSLAANNEFGATCRGDNKGDRRIALRCVA